MKALETPVLLVTFNRPETTLKVLEAIKRVKPKQIFISSDGPRSDRPEDQKKINEVRRLLDTSIDWDCQVHKLYREKNLGCKLGVSGAISWFFENVEAGIILEDDCLPESSFFQFCEELLQKYQQDDQVMMISGDYFVEPKNDVSYYFTKHFHIWGWATWRRAWQNYDIEMKDWPSRKDELKAKLKFNPRVWKSYASSLDQVFEGRLDTWDYQWVFSSWSRGGLAICPTRNLISNIGFGADATHTQSVESIFSCRNILNIEFPLKHPAKIMRDLNEEKKNELVIFPSFFGRLRNKLLKVLGVT